MLILVFLTKRRLQYAQQSIRSLSRLKTQEKIHFHIADDGSGEDYQTSLAHAAEEALGQDTPITLSDSKDRGYGANYNAATLITHSLANADVILPIEDDWELTRDLDVDVMIKSLRENVFSCVRMGYVGYTQSLLAKLVWYQNMHWLEFSEFSSEPHVFSGHPRLETVQFQREVGLWNEGLDAGATEFEVAHRARARQGVAWPIDLITLKGNAWAHIGTDKAPNPAFAEQVLA
jgi:hypothetical protein